MDDTVNSRKKEWEDMSDQGHGSGLSRRSFVQSASAAAFILTATTIVNPIEAWGVELRVLKPETMQTLIQMARDIYPHDRVQDKFYAIAVKDYDTKAADDAKLKALIEDGVEKLNALAQAEHKLSYAQVGWEEQRVALLHKIEKEPFFMKVRSGLVTGLYNQKAVWPLFGYEGESASKGGYIERGFNDIAWL